MIRSGTIPFCPTCNENCNSWFTPSPEKGGPSTCARCLTPLTWPNKRRQVLVDYLKMMADCNDWHAVSDAANDLRELEAEERGREK